MSSATCRASRSATDRASATEYLERGLRALFIFEGEGDIVDRIHTVPSTIAQSLLEEYL